MSKFNSPKNKIFFIKIAQKGETYVQCMNNHYAKFEYLGMKILELQITQTRNHLSISNENISKFKTPEKWTKIMKCAQNRRFTSSICEQ